MQQNLHQGDTLYDLIKIKVHLDEHFYIFSRYLISRMLTLCRVRKLDAIQIAKAIKKQLIEKNQLDIAQSDLQQIIFETMTKFDYQASIPKYQMVASFYGSRTPMIILIFGAPCIGKSFIANALAERLNVSNVLQGDIVEIVMREIESRYFAQLETIEDENDHRLVQNYTRICRIIRKGVSNDIQKCLTEGKPVIIEGSNLMPNFFLRREGTEEEEKMEEEVRKRVEAYINNEMKLKKSQRREPLNFNSGEKLQSKWKIAYPEPEEEVGREGC